MYIKINNVMSFTNCIYNNYVIVFVSNLVIFILSQLFNFICHEIIMLNLRQTKKYNVGIIIV